MEYNCFLHSKCAVVEVICGPMFSGKTEKLIRRMMVAKIACKKILLFKPVIDNRCVADKIISHSKQSMFAKTVKSSKDIENICKKNMYDIDVIGIDEVQFFDFNIINIIKKLSSMNINIVASGLDQDYLGNSFGPMGELLAIADKVSKQYAVCISCGSTATKTQRLVCKNYKEKKKRNTNNIFIGSKKNYEPRCKLCYNNKYD